MSNKNKKSADGLDLINIIIWGLLLIILGLSPFINSTIYAVPIGIFIYIVLKAFFKVRRRFFTTCLVINCLTAFLFFVESGYNSESEESLYTRCGTYATYLKKNNYTFLVNLLEDNGVRLDCWYNELYRDDLTRESNDNYYVTGKAYSGYDKNGKLRFWRFADNAMLVDNDNVEIFKDMEFQEDYYKEIRGTEWDTKLPTSLIIQIRSGGSLDDENTVEEFEIPKPTLLKIEHFIIYNGWIFSLVFWSIPIFIFIARVSDSDDYYE